MAKTKTAAVHAEVEATEPKRGPGRPRKNPAPAAAAGTRASGDEALAIIFETAEATGEGFRHGILGKTRYGKTFHAQRVLWASVDRGLADVALIHDPKREVQYEGLVRASVAELRANPPAEDDPPLWVFHKEIRGQLTVEEVAQFAFDVRAAGQKPLIHADELYHGLSSRQTWDGPTFGLHLREGSGQQISTMWTTQIPQALPTEALDLIETMAIFRLKGRSLRYAAKMLELEPRAVETIKNLDKGEFILLDADGDWDGKVYKHAA